MSDRQAPLRKTRDTAAGAEQTRAALIRAGLEHFGRYGFEGATTRDIAAEAEANIGSIAYHFGGKEGLHAACAQYIVDTVREVAGPVLSELPDGGRMPPDVAEAMLATMLQRMVGFILARPDAGEFVGFILRELNRPTAALDAIYSGVFEPVHKRLCEVWAMATGTEAESDATKIRVFTMIGQIVYFRIGHEAVRRRMGWTSVGPDEVALVVDAARENLSAAIAAKRGEQR